MRVREARSRGINFGDGAGICGLGLRGLVGSRFQASGSAAMVELLVLAALESHETSGVRPILARLQGASIGARS